MILIALYLKFLVFKTCPDALLFASSSFFFSTLAKVGYFLAGKKGRGPRFTSLYLLNTDNRETVLPPSPRPHCAHIIVGGTV